MGRFNRRSMLRTLGYAPLGSMLSGAGLGQSLPDPPSADAPVVARDEAFWSEIRRFYPRTEGIINLEHGYWGKMALPVQAHYQAATEMVNRQNSYYARTRYGDDLLASEASVAGALKVRGDEIALTRNATEAIHNLLRQYRDFGPGDAILYADIDYPSYQRTIEALAGLQGAEAVRLALPSRVDAQTLQTLYAQAFDAHPNLKLMLLTHVSNQHGLVLPVREIAAAARARGIAVICDCAQSWGLLDFDLPSLGVDWAGFNLHKWIGSPVGVGALYMRQGSLEKVGPYPGETDEAGVRARIHTATSNFAAMTSVPAALEFHAALGPALKEARLRYLRSIWTEAAASIPTLEIPGGLDETTRSGLGAFRLAGRPGAEDNIKLQKVLAARYGIFTVARHGLATGSCVRITPQVFTSIADIEALVAAMQTLHLA